MVLKFLEGSQEKYDNMIVKESGTFYLTESNLYLGRTKINNQDIIGDLRDLTTADKENLVSAINEVIRIVGKKADLDSPNLTGTPTVPTATEETNDAQIANTRFVKTAIANLINGAPTTLDTLKELADAIQANKTIVEALEAAIGNKVDKVYGKGLSTNDFTDDYKSKLDSIASEAEVNVQSDWNETSATNDAYIKNKPNFIVSGTQTITVTEDEGVNTYTFTSSNGSTSDFNVRNGSKGSKGDTGTRGTRIFTGTSIDGTLSDGNTYSTGILEALYGDVYINVNTCNVYLCVLGGNQDTAEWSYSFNIKGAVGERGSLIHIGTGISGTNTSETIFANSGIENSHVNDIYINTSMFRLYQCTVGGNPSVAKWIYIGSIKSSSSGTSNIEGYTTSHDVAIGDGVRGLNGSSFVAIGTNSYSSYGGVAIGNGSMCSEGEIAIGGTAKSNKDNSISLGYFANCDSSYSIAIGNRTKANTNANSSIIIGHNSCISGSNSIAIGHEIPSVKNNSIIIGMKGTFQDNTISIIASRSNGLFSYSDNSSNSIIISPRINSTGIKIHDSVVIGHENNTIANIDSSVSIGAYSRSLEKSVAIGACAKSYTNGISIGFNSYGDGLQGIAIGESSNCNSYCSVVIGASAKALNGTSVCLGQGASCYSNAESSIAIGSGATVTNPNTIQLGGANVSSLKCKVSLTTTSDERDKIDIQPIRFGALDFINKLEPITYKSNQRILYIDDYENLSDEDKAKKETYGICEYDRESHAIGTKKGNRQRVGVKAKQVQNALKDIFESSSYANLVDDNLFDFDKTEIPEGIESQLSVNYEGFIPFLIKAIQELSQKIENLEKGSIA